MSRGKTAAAILTIFFVYAYGWPHAHKLRALIPEIGVAKGLDKGRAYQQTGYYTVASAEPLGYGKWSVTFIDEEGVLRRAKFQDDCEPSPGRIIFVEWIEYEKWPDGRSNFARCGTKY